MPKAYVLTNPRTKRKKKSSKRPPLPKRLIKKHKGNLKKAWADHKKKKRKRKKRNVVATKVNKPRKNKTRRNTVAKRANKSHKRTAAAKKGARTRARKKAVRVKAGKKAARTRKRRGNPRRRNKPRTRVANPRRKRRRKRRRRRRNPTVARANPRRRRRRKRGRKRRRRNPGLTRANPFKAKSQLKEAHKTLGWAVAGYAGFELANILGSMAEVDGKARLWARAGGTFLGAVGVGWLASFVLSRETARAMMAGGLIKAAQDLVMAVDVELLRGQIMQARAKLASALPHPLLTGTAEYLSPEGAAEYLSPEGVAYV